MSKQKRPDPAHTMRPIRSAGTPLGEPPALAAAVDAWGKTLPEQDAPAIEAASEPAVPAAVEIPVVAEPAPAEPIISAHQAGEGLIHLWEVPGLSGYSLRIEVPCAGHTVNETRAGALAVRLADGDGTRGLNRVEAHWVQTTEPLIVRDTTAVTMDHDALLTENERLRDENEAWREARDLFESLAIDINDPGEWVRRVHAEKDAHIAAAREADNRRRIRLVDALVGAIKAIESAVDETGYAPEKAPPPAEPDYGALTVLAPAGTEPRLYPRLAGANWANLDPREEITGIEAEGRDLLLRILDDACRRELSEMEQAAVRAYEARIRATL